MPRRALALLIFFFSGAAALAYEMIWIRLFRLTLSITVYALTAVLCAYMSGLALRGLALAMGRKESVAVAPLASQEEPQPLSPVFAPVAVACAISGSTAMGCEILGNRALEHDTHNSTYAYLAIPATFLLALGAGSGGIARFADRFRQPVLAIAIRQERQDAVGAAA